MILQLTYTVIHVHRYDTNGLQVLMDVQADMMMMISLLQNSVVHTAEDLKVLHLMMCSHIDIVVTMALNQI